jgi:hypothetical protein
MHDAIEPRGLVDVGTRTEWCPWLWGEEWQQTTSDASRRGGLIRFRRDPRFDLGK